jgi:hypothetical protein
MMAFRVFISHAGSDPLWAEALAASLEMWGAAAWLGGTNPQWDEAFERRLERALRDSDLVIGLVAPENAENPSLNFELGAALGMGKRMVGIVPGDFDAARLPFPLRGQINLVKGSPEQTAQRLLGAAA